MFKKIKVESKYDEVANRCSYMEQPCLFRKSFSFENRTDIAITIQDRNNFPVVFNPNPNNPYFREQVFVIKTSYEFLSSAVVRDVLFRLDEFQRAYDVQDNNHTLMHRVLHELWRNAPNATMYRFTIEHHIKIDDLRRYKAVYEEDTDYLVCTADGWLKTPHPFSHEGRLINDHSELLSGKNVSGCLIEVVDNDNMISDRFIYCAKNLIRVKSTVDKTRHSGVYFSKLENNEHSADKVEFSFMPFSDAEEKLGLFRTAEDAMTGGAPDLLAKKEASEAQRQVEIMKREAEMAKAAAKKKETELESELHNIRAAYQRLKEEKEIESLKRDERERQRKEEFAEREDQRKDRAHQRSDYYEERSYYRKDSSEFFKWLPAIVAGAIGVGALILRKIWG